MKLLMMLFLGVGEVWLILSLYPDFIGLLMISSAMVMVLAWVVAVIVEEGS